MRRLRQPLFVAALAFAGVAGSAAAQSGDNPAAIDQLSIPLTSGTTLQPAPPRLDPAAIAAQELELRIAEAEDTAFAAALLDALLNNRIASSPNPPIFIPRPPEIFISQLEEVPVGSEETGAPQLSALRPAARPLVAAPTEGVAQPARTTREVPLPAAALDCAADSLSWTPTCATSLETTAEANEDEIKTLEDGVYVKN
ncbi:MAG: hypothetical protein ACU0BP_14260 [Sulfitobacter sp.]